MKGIEGFQSMVVIVFFHAILPDAVQSTTNDGVHIVAVHCFCERIEAFKEARCARHIQQSLGKVCMSVRPLQLHH